MRAALGLLHRWLGLSTAIFLFVAGLTGAVISWDHELDEWLNPQLFQARSGISAKGQLPPLALARQIESADTRLRVSYLPLSVEPGRALGVSVSPRTDPASGKPYEPGFNQLALDPATGQVQGRREWGAVSLSRENLLPFLYKLHYSLHIPDAGTLGVGILFMGLVALLWTLDCFIALWISFPRRKAWRKSLAFRWREGGHKLNFDLHRSGGVWTWVLLLVMAWTSVAMNLGSDIVRPLVSVFSTLSPNIFDERPAEAQPVEPGFTREQVLEVAGREAARRGWQAPAGAIFYADHIGVYGVAFFAPGHDHGDGGLGNPWLYVDARTGALVGDQVPGTGSAGDIFMQAQFPLHSGRILGLPGRILISCMGLVVAVLSVTGLVIWARKRRARAAVGRLRASNSGGRVAA